MIRLSIRGETMAIAMGLVVPLGVAAVLSLAMVMQVAARRLLLEDLR